MVDQGWPYTNVGGADGDLAEKLQAVQREIGDLVSQITAQVEAVDPATADWGDLGDLNRTAELLRRAAGEDT